LKEGTKKLLLSAASFGRADRVAQHSKSFSVLFFKKELLPFLRAIAPYALILATSIALLATAPVAGNFWNSDAPRHAMDGLFVRDFVTAAPIQTPLRWATSYYFRHPAIAIPYYPPFFAAVLAVFYTVFGASQFVAQAAVGCFTFLLGLSSFQVARRIMPDAASLGAALLVIGIPLATMWERQVMLDVPAYALAVASLWCLARYLEGERFAPLAAAALAMVLAIYTKYNIAFVVTALAVGWCAARRAAPWRDRRLVAIGAAALAMLLPAAFLVAKFGSANAQSLFGRTGDAPAASLAAWIYYPASLPDQTGILLVPFCLAGLAALLLRARERNAWLVLCLLTWLVVGYATFSIIPIKEERHDLAVLFPLLIAVPCALVRFVPKFGGMIALVLGIFVAARGIAAHAPRVDGYAEIATYIAAHAPPNAVVLYDGYRDANLVFDLMTIAHRPDIAVVRADKLLLSVRFGERASRGVSEAAFQADDIARLIRRVQPDYIVLQPDFWSDLRVMALFVAAIKPPSYRQMHHFALTGDLSTRDGTGGIDVYAPTAAPSGPRGGIELRMPDFDSRFTGVP
jgi:hypothetical protein